MELKPINFQEKLAKFSDYWSPKIIAQMNDYHFKLVKFQGDFIWHNHDDTDEVFIVLDGKMNGNLPFNSFQFQFDKEANKKLIKVP